MGGEEKKKGISGEGDTYREGIGGSRVIGTKRGRRALNKKRRGKGKESKA